MLWEFSEQIAHFKHFKSLIRIYHDIVRIALEKDGWTITDDSYYIRVLDATFHVDLGAEKVLAAKKGKQKIAVEVKSFLNQSFMTDFHAALGQFINYVVAMGINEPDRTVYLAVPHEVYEAHFQKAFIQKVVKINKIKYFTFDQNKSEIIVWKS